VTSTLFRNPLAKQPVEPATGQDKLHTQIHADFRMHTDSFAAVGFRIPLQICENPQICVYLRE